MEFKDYYAFEAMFARRHGGCGRHEPPGRGGFRTRGQDHHARVLIDLEDAIHGAVRRFTLQSPEVEEAGHVRVRERTPPGDLYAVLEG